MNTPRNKKHPRRTILNLSPVRNMAMAMAFALTASMACAQENLVPNPSFELILDDVEVKTSRSLVC